MSNKTRLQTNNNNLQTILNTVNSLPEGGSGGSVETCTVTVNFEDSCNSINCIQYINNNYEVYNNNSKTSYTIENVPVNSAIFVYQNGINTLTDITTTGDIVGFFPNAVYGGNSHSYIVVITGTADATITYKAKTGSGGSGTGW